MMMEKYIRKLLLNKFQPTNSIIKKFTNNGKEKLHKKRDCDKSFKIKTINKKFAITADSTTSGSTRNC